MTDTPELATEGLTARVQTLRGISVDLLDVALWLTEYWSTALPLPTTDSYQPDRTGLRLQVWCTIPAEFQAARDTLARDLDGALEVRHCTLGTAGDERTYAEATRAFGTITIHIIGLADQVDPDSAP